MNKDIANKLCQHFGFGNLLRSPEAVTGGLIHKMWHIKTHSGEYAVKELNPHIMTRKNIIEEYERSERIAQAFKDNGLPAVASILNQNHSVVAIDNSYFIVYPWINATILSNDSITESHAKIIGEILAKMYQVNLSFPDLPVPGGDSHSNEYITSLSKKSLHARLPFAKHFEEKLEDILLWNNLYQEAVEQLNKHLLVGHGDLDPKNVLWRNDGTPVLIDWEGASLINPTRDIISTALAWSGVDLLNVDVDILRSMLHEYQLFGGKLSDDIKAAFSAQLGGINWMVYNIQRSLGEASTSENERQLGITQTEHTLRTLEYIANNIKIWIKIVQ